jgi:hypothetical protein
MRVSSWILLTFLCERGEFNSVACKDKQCTDKKKLKVIWFMYIDENISWAAIKTEE